MGDLGWRRSAAAGRWFTTDRAARIPGPPKLRHDIALSSPRRTLCLALASACAALGATAATASAQSASVSDSVNLAGATSVAVSGSYAYTTAYYAGRVTALDISNPAKPFIAGETPASTPLYGGSNITLAGGYAYVVSKNRNGPQGSNTNDDGTGNSLTILDVTTNPAQPTIVGSVRDPVNLFGAYGIAVAGGYAYVAAQGCLGGQPCPNPKVGNSFAVVDVSLPSDPIVVATLHNSSLPSPWAGTNALDHPTSVAISGNYAYVTSSYSNRLTVVDISNPLSPRIVASLLSSTKLNFDVDVTIAGSDAYVANQNASSELAVVDISNPLSPQIVGSLSNSSMKGAYRIKVHGNFAWISASSAQAVDVVDVSDPTHPRIAGVDTDATHLNRTTGLDVDASGTHAIASSPYLASQSNVIYPPYPGQPGGPTLTGTLTDIAVDVNPIGVTIAPSSRPPNPTSQTTANFTFTTTDKVSTVRCQLDGGPLGFCTTATTARYAGLGAGSHTFTVEAIDASGNTASASYTWTITGGATGPTKTQPPTISGSPTEGQTLLADPGVWSGSPTFAYQWEDCNGTGTTCSPIASANGTSYTLHATDVGSTIVVVVTATSGGVSSAHSTPTTAIGSAPGPLTPVLDDFNRADNAGPPGPSWSPLPDFDTTSANTLLISGHEATGVSGENADYWNAQTFGADSEAYVTVVTKPTANNDIVVLGLRYRSPSVLNGSSGYQARFVNQSAGTDYYQILLRTNGANTTTVLATVTGPELLAGDQLLFRAIGSTLELWRGSGGAWTRILTATNGSITSGGYLALIARGAVVRLDNFGGGTLP